VLLHDLRCLAGRLGAELAEGQSVFEVLQAFTMHVLNFFREEALAHVAMLVRGGATVTDSCKGDVRSVRSLKAPRWRRCRWEAGKLTTAFEKGRERNQ